MSLRFAFTPLGPVTALGRAHITVTGDQSTATSANHMPDQSVVLSIALTDLVAAADTLLTTPGAVQEFAGVGSSFTLILSRSDDRVAVAHHGKTIGSTTVGEFAAMCADDLLPAARAVLAKLPPGSAHDDLDVATTDLTITLEDRS